MWDCLGVSLMPYLPPLCDGHVADHFNDDADQYVHQCDGLEHQTQGVNMGQKCWEYHEFTWVYMGLYLRYHENNGTYQPSKHWNIMGYHWFNAYHGVRTIGVMTFIPELSVTKLIH